MATNSATIGKQTFYVTVMLAVIIGFLAGVVFTIYRTGGQPTPARESLAKQESQAILRLEADVTANPDNIDAWTQLAHLYFDTSNYNKAIGAYTKALAIRPDANLWTDLGVMYRRAGNPTKAIESFEQAIAMDPGHLQSRFNKGIVLHFDLDRTDEALEVWQSVLALNNDYRMGNNQLLREFLETVRTEAAQ